MTSSKIDPSVVAVAVSSADSAVPSTSILQYPHSLLPLVIKGNEPRMDSRIIANELGVEHKATYQLINQYQADFEEFGPLPFEMEAVKVEGARGAKHQKFCLLNEDQACLLMTYSQNTEQARKLKKNLIRAFSNHRASMELRNHGGWLPIPTGHTTRPLIQSRNQLSFRTIDPQTNKAVSSLEDSAATWDVPHDLSESKAEKLGQAYFAELLELNDQNPIEAHKALLEVFLFGWKTPLACHPLKTETKFIKGLDKSVQVATLDSWVNPDLIARHSLEQGFLKAMISRTLGGVA
jgi:hypothetical protein